SRALVLRLIGVDAKLAALRYAGRVVALGVDAGVAAVLEEALPDDDEVPGGVHGHGRLLLVVRGVGVDAKLDALRRAVGAVALGVDAVAAAVLTGTGPDDNIIPGRVHCDVRVALTKSGLGRGLCCRL